MDPCWLPSAIMQTMGAMLGIYVGIYVLAVQRFLKSLERRHEKLHEADGMPQILEEGGRLMNIAKEVGGAVGGFYALIIACSFTIIANALWLDSIATNIIIPRELSVLGVIGLSSFLFSVGYICLFSILLTKRLLKFEGDKIIEKSE